MKGIVHLPMKVIVIILICLILLALALMALASAGKLTVPVFTQISDLLKGLGG